MNFFLQNRTSAIIITVLIALNLFSIYFFVVHKRISHRRHSPKDRSSMREDRNRDKPNGQVHFMERELGFDKSQREAFQKLKKDHFKKSASKRREMGVLRELMFENLDNSTFNKDSIVNIIGSTQVQLEIDMYEHFRAVRNICTEEQKVKFDKMVKRITKKMTQREPRSGRTKSE